MGLHACACEHVRIVEETGRRFDDASEGRHYIVDGTDAVAEEVDDVVGVERRCAAADMPKGDDGKSGNWKFRATPYGIWILIENEEFIS